VNEKS